MLQITADVYSGRPNPTWLVHDEAEARAIMRELGQRRMTTAAAPEEGGLGLRGFHIDVASDEASASDRELAGYLAVGATASSEASALGERLVALLSRDASAMASESLGQSPDDLATYLTAQIHSVGHASVTDAREGAEGAEDDEIAAEAIDASRGIGAKASCTIELGAFNPGFWNTAATQPHNNCYNYASNKRTNTFAQPGRATGHMYGHPIACLGVTNGALSDGLHRRYVCFPASEAPRYLVALVVAPGQDYHWYRKQKEGFWGHKPGGTAAKNTDNSGHVITNPQTANRGPYTQFCGYFYTCRSQRIN